MGHVDQIFSLGSVIQQAHESCLILTMHKSLGGNLPSKPRPGQIFFSTKRIFNEKKTQVLTQKQVCITGEVGAFLHLTMNK